MAKVSGKLANRYARALYDALTKEQGRSGTPSPAQIAAAELRSFSNLWQQEKTLEKQLLNPLYRKEERRAALIQVAARAGFSDLAQRFLAVLFDRDRLLALSEIARAFSEKADSEAGVVRVQVSTARAISEPEKQEIKSRLLAQIKGQLEVSWEQNPSLLGGIVVRYQGKVLDGSISGRLERIERSLAA